MAHELTFTGNTADFFEVGAVRSAWHREGILLAESPQSTDDAARLIHADYRVEKQPVRYHGTSAEGHQYEKESALAYLTVREDTGAELGAVGPQYQVVQNADAFRATIGPLVNAGIIRLETGAVLRGGASAFLLGRLDTEQFGPIAREVFAQEGILPYVGIATDHSGKRGNFLALTSIRWVCGNTLGVDEARAVRLESSGSDHDERLATIRHTGDAEAKHVDAAQRLLGGLIERAEAVAKAYRILKGFYLDEALFRTLVIEPSIGKHPTTRPEFNPDARLANAVVERWERREGEIKRLWTAGKGHTGDHTAWEGYNGLVEAVDHDADLFPSRGGVYRLGTLLTGELRAKKERVLHSLLSAAAAHSASER